MEFILASHSPRRKELLARILPVFHTKVLEVDERCAAVLPAEYVCALALKKALAVQRNEAIIIGADTTVVLGDMFLGKPKDETDAFDMLKSLQGCSHDVYTGMAIVNGSTGEQVMLAEKTQVTFADMKDWEIHRYLESGDYKDKAGAYGIQGEMSRHIRRIDGCYYNVMGLPVNALYEALKKFVGKEAFKAYLCNR